MASFRVSIWRRRTVHCAVCGTVVQKRSAVRLHGRYFCSVLHAVDDVVTEPT